MISFCSNLLLIEKGKKGFCPNLVKDHEIYLQWNLAISPLFLFLNCFQLLLFALILDLIVFIPLGSRVGVFLSKVE